MLYLYDTKRYNIILVLYNDRKRFVVSLPSFEFFVEFVSNI